MQHTQYTQYTPGHRWINAVAAGPARGRPDARAGRPGILRNVSSTTPDRASGGHLPGHPPGRPLQVAVLGCGIVGQEVVRLLVEHAADLTARVGVPLELAGIAVRHAGRARELPVDPKLFTDDADGLVSRGDIDLVVEVIGGIEPARSLISSALEHGASVVTANKALLAEDGPSLYEIAEKAGRDLFYEASVTAAIPLLRPLRESLAGDRVTRIVGIVNGTTNYVLDQMDTHGVDLATAIARAQQLGYAEADPGADIDGHDAAAKAAILASLAFHTRISSAEVYRVGIAGITPADMAAARAIGRVVKLLAICELGESDGPGSETEGARAVSVRVHPAMVDCASPLAAVREAYNAVLVEAEAAGSLMFYGPGAGGRPTASAVLGDLVSAARNRLADTHGPGESSYAAVRAVGIGESSTRYHLRLRVADRPGVLAAVAEVFGRRDVSIATVRQQGGGSDAELVVVTHLAREDALAATVADLAKLPVVTEVAGVIRVEGAR